MFWIMIHGKNKSTQWFQVGTFKIYAIANRSSLLLLLLQWISTWSILRQVFLEVNLNKKTLKLYTSWKCWKNQCRSIMLYYGTSMNINILVKYLLNISLIQFVALVSFYTPWNVSENQGFPDVFRGHHSWAPPLYKAIWISHNQLWLFSRGQPRYPNFNHCILLVLAQRLPVSL